MCLDGIRKRQIAMNELSNFSKTRCIFDIPEFLQLWRDIPYRDVYPTGPKQEKARIKRNEVRSELFQLKVVLTVQLSQNRFLIHCVWNIYSNFNAELPSR